MELLYKINIALISCTILSIMLFLSNVFNRYIKKQQLLEERSKKERNKKKRKQQKIKKQVLESKIRKSKGQAILLFVLIITCSAGTYFSNQYFTSHLTNEDSEALVKGFYLIENVEKQLNDLQQTDNPVKTRNNLREMAAQMAGYGVHHAYSNLTEERQRNLNHYYKKLKETGLSLANESVSEIADDVLYENYIGDIEALKKEQSGLLKDFSVNEDALKSKK